MLLAALLMVPLAPVPIVSVACVALCAGGLLMGVVLSQYTGNLSKFSSVDAVRLLYVFRRFTYLLTRMLLHSPTSFYRTERNTVMQPLLPSSVFQKLFSCGLPVFSLSNASSCFASSSTPSLRASAPSLSGQWRTQSTGHCGLAFDTRMMKRPVPRTL